MESVDEGQVEGDVDGESGDGDEHGGSGVEQAAQSARDGEQDQHRGEPEGADPQVGGGLLLGCGGGTERGREGVGRGSNDGGRDRAETEGEPEPCLLYTSRCV